MADSSDTAAAPLRPREGQPSERARAILLVVALAAGFAAVPRATQSCAGSGRGEAAPDFTARVVANGDVLGAGTLEVDLKSLRGKAVVLDFWATWCGPCQAEGPIVDAVARRYGEKITVLGVNTSDEEGLAAAYVQRRKLTFPIVYDQGNAIARRYSVSSLPTLIVISKSGQIVAERHGITTDADLDDLVRRYM